MPDAPKLPERETYTAKQIATRIGTDAKTLRKFFRSPASTADPVGQGGRYEFDAALLPKIREEFKHWKTRSTPKAAPKAAPVTAPKTSYCEGCERDFPEEELLLDENGIPWCEWCEAVKPENEDISLDDLADLVEEIQAEETD